MMSKVIRISLQMGLKIQVIHILYNTLNKRGKSKSNLSIFDISTQIAVRTTFK